MSELLGFASFGVVQGMVYGVIALGITLIYKASRTLNLAQPFMGLFAAYLTWYLTGSAGIPGAEGTAIGGIDTGPWFIRWIRYPLGLFLFDLGSRPRFVLAAVISLALIMRIGYRVEHDIFRRLERAPRLVTMVATIALAQGFLGAVLLLFERTEEQSSHLKRLPVLLPESWNFAIGPVPFTAGDVQILLVVPILAAGMAVFFKRSKFGVAIRATAENREAAQLLGVSARKVASFTWIFAGFLAGIGALLIIPSMFSLDAERLGIGILIRALAAAIVGGLTSLPGALWGGVLVGVVEFLVRWRTGTPGVPEVVIFFLVFAALVVRTVMSRRRTEEQIALVPAVRELPSRLRRHHVSGQVRTTTLIVGIMLVAAVSLGSGPRTNGVLVEVFAYAIAAVGLTVLIGYAGQVSLGHWALVGVGAFAAGNLYDFGPVPFPLMIPLVVVVGMAVSFLLGLSALWVRGPYLAVVTLAFAVAASQWIFTSDVVARGTAGITVTAQDYGWLNLGSRTNRPLFFFAFAAFLFCAWVAHNFKQSRTGRGFFSLRENEKAAATFGVELTRYRFLAFVLSGGMAALAGVVFGLRAGQVAALDFQPIQSLELVAIVIIGGIGSVFGALLGAFLIKGLPALLSAGLGAAAWVSYFVTFFAGLSLIAVIVWARGGLAGLVLRFRDPVVAGMVWEAESLKRRAPATADEGDRVPADPS